MIRSFACKDTEALFKGERVARFANMMSVAERKLTMLHAAVVLDDLKSPPGNKLEALSKDRTGQHSISINAQWRVCFVWTEDGPINVEIVDFTNTL